MRFKILTIQCAETKADYLHLIREQRATHMSTIYGEYLSPD